jgi:hypothetical protein
MLHRLSWRPGAVVSLLALAVGRLSPADWVNLRLPARDVGSAIMPPDMIMDRDTEAMIDIAAVDPRAVRTTYGMEVRGGRELVRTWRAARKYSTSIQRSYSGDPPSVSVDAYAFNGKVPPSLPITTSLAGASTRHAGQHAARLT